jgi:hypothetical protein
MAENKSFEESKWKPGQSGNPSGRPKGAKTGLRSRLMQMLDQDPPEDIIKELEAKGISLEAKDKAGVIAEVIGRSAMKSDVQAAKFIAEQTELPHPREVGLSGDFTVHISPEDAGTL